MVVRVATEPKRTEASKAPVYAGNKGDAFAGRRPTHGQWEPHPDHAAGKDFGQKNPSNPTAGV